MRVCGRCCSEIIGRGNRAIFCSDKCWNAERRQRYAANPEPRKRARRDRYAKNVELMRQKDKERYPQRAEKNRAECKNYYLHNRDEILAKKRAPEYRERQRQNRAMLSAIVRAVRELGIRAQ